MRPLVSATRIGHSYRPLVSGPRTGAAWTSCAGMSYVPRWPRVDCGSSMHRLEFTLKTPWADGTTALLLSPQELLEKLSALVPPPRQHLIRYHGVLAPASADRGQIVPGPSALASVSDNGGSGQANDHHRHGHRVEWARLLARVFQIDVTVCPSCGGRMKLIAALTAGASVYRYLEGVGLPSRAPPIAPARIDRQLEFDEGA